MEGVAVRFTVAVAPDRLCRGNLRGIDFLVLSFLVRGATTNVPAGTWVLGARAGSSCPVFAVVTWLGRTVPSLWKI